MVYSYTPTYYSSLHDTITSICKNILPFSSSLKKRRLPAAEQKLSKQQSDNLKWQQESYHRILNLIGLRNEGIVQESEVSAFRSQLLDTLISSPSPTDQEHPTIIRDKLVFLQELLYAKCISGEEYHSSKRPLLQRLAVQGAEIEARDVIVAESKSLTERSSEELEEEEQWSVIDIKDDESCLMKGKENRLNSNTPKNKSPNPMKQRIKGGAASMISLFVNTTPYRSDKNKGKKLGAGGGGGGVTAFSANNSSAMNQFHSGGGGRGDGCFKENPFWEDDHHHEESSKEKESESSSIVMLESKATEQVKKKKKKKSFTTNLFKQREQISKEEEEEEEDESTVTPLAKQSKRKMMHSGSSASNFIDDHKVLGDNIKKELSRIQTELASTTTAAATTNSNPFFSNDKMETYSTRLPVDKTDLQKFFPKTWCDRNGDGVLDVVRKEIKNAKQQHHHHGANANKNNGIDSSTSTSDWVANFDDDMNENSHPNLFSHQQPPTSSSFINHNNPFSY